MVGGLTDVLDSWSTTHSYVLDAQWTDWGLGSILKIRFPKKILEKDFMSIIHRLKYESSTEIVPFLLNVYFQTRFQVEFHANMKVNIFLHLGSK